MRLVRFASVLAAALALTATTADAAVVEHDIGPFSFLIGGEGPSAQSVAAADAKFRSPLGVRYHPDGRLFIADQGASQIRVLDAVVPIVTEFAGSHAYEMAFSRDGMVLFTCSLSSGIRMYEAETGARLSTNERGDQFGFPARYLAVSPLSGDLYAAQVAGRNWIYRYQNPYSLTQARTETGKHEAGIRGVAVDPTTGNVLYGVYSQLCQAGPDMQSNKIVIAGNGGTGHVDGEGTQAEFHDIGSITVSADGSYAFLAIRSYIRRISLASPYQVTTVFNSAGATPAPNNAPQARSYDGATGGELQSMSFNPAGDTLVFSIGSGRNSIFTIAYNGPIPPPCNCDAQKLHADLSSNAIPDATADAVSSISLDTDTWEVVFEVRNVKAIDNGHVLAAAVNTQEAAEQAFTPIVSSWDANALWNPSRCGLGVLDVPATPLRVQANWDHVACRAKYEMRYSLIEATGRDERYCDLLDDNAGNVKVKCSIVLSSVRAYGQSDPIAFTTREAAFAAELDLGTYRNNEATDLLHTMAKCSVKNGPLHVVDCRVPGVWNFLQKLSSTALIVSVAVLVVGLVGAAVVAMKRNAAKERVCGAVEER